MCSSANTLSLPKVDNWATFSATARIAVLVQQLRRQLDELLKQPDVWDRAQPTLEAVMSLLASDGF